MGRQPSVAIGRVLTGPRLKLDRELQSSWQVMTNVPLAATNGPLSRERLHLRMLIGMRKKIALAVRRQLGTGDCRLRQDRTAFIDRDCG